MKFIAKSQLSSSSIKLAWSLILIACVNAHINKHTQSSSFSLTLSWTHFVFRISSFDFLIRIYWSIKFCATPKIGWSNCRQKTCHSTCHKVFVFCPHQNAYVINTNQNSKWKTRKINTKFITLRTRQTFL